MQRSVVDFGARGDGVQLDTGPIQRAIDACAAQGGGTVAFPPGTYRSAALLIKSNVTLYLCAGAKIAATGNPKDYAPNLAVLSAQGAENIAVTGPGVVDGVGAKVRDSRYPVLHFVGCRNVKIADATLRDSSVWCGVFTGCRHVTIDGIRIDSCVNANNDGLDIVGCQDVCISNCRIRCEDDAITLKTENQEPCKNIVISNCILTSRWAAFRFGSESRGNFQDIAVSNCVIHDTFGCGIKLQMVEGAEMKDIVFSNIVMQNVTGPISIRLGNWISGGLTREGNECRHIGVLRNVLFDNIRVQVAERPRNDLHQTNGYPRNETEPGEIRSCISITGQPDHPVEGIAFNNVRITFPGGGTAQEAARRDIPDLRDTYPEYFMFGVLPAYGLYAHHVQGLTLSNVRFELAAPDRRPAVVYDDVKDVDERGFRADGAAK